LSLIGIINSDESINSLILNEFYSLTDNEYQLRNPRNDEKILQFLDYDLPEIVIVNLTDKNLNLDYIFEQVKNDSWLHNFGIVGLFDPKEANEKNLFEKFKSLNLLTVLDYTKIKSHIVKHVRIIDKNRQIIFQSELVNRLVDQIAGSFIIDNDVLLCPLYSSLFVNLIFHMGYIDSEIKVNLQLAISELILNSIEHGNCKISAEEKEALLMEGGNILELILEKNKNPEVSKKKVYFEWEIRPDYSKLTICDEGEGFDVLAYLDKIKVNDPGALLGRGIKLARLFSSSLSYNKKGNIATLKIKHEKHLEKKSPIGFLEEEVVKVKKDEEIFKQNDFSDFLYYITSGRYEVYHDSTLVGVLSPQDIFMGEMSFLLNNRRSATVKAETAGKLIKINRRTFISVIKKYPHYGVFLSKLLARKLARANVRSSDLNKSKKLKAKNLIIAN